MKLFRSGLFLFLGLSSTVTFAADWKLASDQDGIAVYTQKVPGQDFKNFRGITEINVPARNVMAAIADTDRMPQWFYNMKENRSFEQKGVMYRYLWIRAPFPAQDRDAVVTLNVSQDPNTKAVTALTQVAHNVLPPHDKRVRIPRMRSGWIVTPLGPNKTKVQLEGNADPGGMIPIFVANLIVAKMPRETLKNLRHRLEKTTLVDPRFLNTDPVAKKTLEGIVIP